MEQYFCFMANYVGFSFLFWGQLMSLFSNVYKLDNCTYVHNSFFLAITNCETYGAFTFDVKLLNENLGGILGGTQC
jgi:hypothetical protein